MRLSVPFFAFYLASCSSMACTPVVIRDAKTGETLSVPQLVKLQFNKSTYVLVGDVVQATTVEESRMYARGRVRRYTFQEATIRVRKSWKPSKKAGDTLRIRSDLDHSCSAEVTLGAQVLVYAKGEEPVALWGTDRTSPLGFASEDVAILDSIVAAESQPPGTKPGSTRDARVPER